MAYDVNKLAKLAALQELAQKMKDDYATKQEVGVLESKVNGLVATGGEPNVIETIKVNGTAQTVADKAVNITVPTNVSALTNDSKYQTDTQVSAAIQSAISASGHASFEKADTVPAAASAQENVLYLVMNSTTGHYDIYALVSGEVVLLDDTTVDLSSYATTAAMNTALGGKVDKVDGKGLSANDYTTEEKNKLAGLSNYTHPTYAEKAAGLYKVTVDATGHVSAAVAVTKSDITALGIPAQDTTYDIATDLEVTEMLTAVFG